MSLGHVRGVNLVIAKMLAYGKASQRAMKQGVIDTALDVRRKAQENAPIDLGNLKASAAMITADTGIPTTPTWRNVSSEQAGELSAGFKAAASDVHLNVARNSLFFSFDAAVMFGANYSVFVHETHPTKSKFLERAYRDEGRNLNKNIVKRMKGGA